MTWGIKDTQDNVWIGNDKGPNTYDDQTIARVAAQLYDECMDHEPGRTRAEPYGDDARRIRDHVTLKRSLLEGVRRLEGGHE